MLFILLRPLADQFILFNLIRYITFRSGIACLTALVLALVLGPATSGSFGRPSTRSPMMLRWI